MRALSLFILFIISSSAIAFTQMHSTLLCPMKSQVQADVPDCHHHTSEKKSQDQKKNKKSQDCPMACCHLTLMQPNQIIHTELVSTKIVQKFTATYSHPQWVIINIFRPPIA